MVLAKAIESDHILCGGNKIIVGHALDVLKTLPSESVDCVVTSPPYWRLRDYHTEPVEWSDGWVGQLGLEPTPQLYIQHLVAIFDEVRRVLKKTGTCWVNLGDRYGGTTKTAKSLAQIPSRFAIAMTDAGWILRNEIIWHKPNCLPSNVKDRFTVDFEKLFFFTKSKKYYFERQFEPMSEASASRYKYRFGGAKNEAIKETDNPTYVVGMRSPTDGRNKRTVWTITPKPYKGAHFATFPPELVEIPIKAGCPEFVCSRCGHARKTIYNKWWDNPVEEADRREANGTNWQEEGAQRMNKGRFPTGVHYDPVGLTDCGCGAPFVPGVVLDPFGGSGTTAAVAKQLGRNSIMIELNPNYIPLMEKRVGDSNVKIVDMLGGVEA